MPLLLIAQYVVEKLFIKFSLRVGWWFSGLSACWMWIWVQMLRSCETARLGGMCLSSQGWEARQEDSGSDSLAKTASSKFSERLSLAVWLKVRGRDKIDFLAYLTLKTDSSLLQHILITVFPPSTPSSYPHLPCPPDQLSLYPLQKSVALHEMTVKQDKIRHSTGLLTLLCS